MVIGLYNALAMNGEAGELAEKIKKAARDGVKDPVEHRRNAGLELGDVLVVR
jgi:NTP pyrophosphatase (non-canonical NTP hydrolase)